MLSEIKTILMENRCASIHTLAYRLKADPEMVRAMLDHWIRKGKVVQRGGAAAAGKCGGCAQCGPATLEVYEWVE